MKKIGLFLAFLFSALLLSAQDIIVKNSGETIKAYNLEVSGTSVFFQLSAEPDAPLQKLPKTEILVVRKADGTKLDFDAPAPQPTAQQQQTTTAQNKPVKITLDMLSEEERAENERLIKQYNEPVKFEVLKEGQDVVSVYACFCPKQSSIMSNKDLSISLLSGYVSSSSRTTITEFKNNDFPCHGTYVVVSITNKTDQTIYVDLGNTMLVSQGRSVPFYVPQTTTTSNTSVGGGSVNLGALTGSRLFGGISVGGSNASSTVNTVFSQRVIAVAPYGTVQTPPVPAWGGETEERELGKGLRWMPDRRKNGITYGESFLNIYLPSKSLLGGQVLNYTEENAPLNVSAYVSYAFTEDCAQQKTMPVHYYLKHFVGRSRNNFTGKYYIEIKDFLGLGFTFWNSKTNRYEQDYFPLP